MQTRLPQISVGGLRRQCRCRRTLPLQGYRIISAHPPDGGGEFRAALATKIADVNYQVAAELWQMVYDRGRDLPASVADPR
jgi:hypothetical protein